MEKTNWIVVHKTESSFNAKAVEGALKENDFPAVLMQKRDSAYNNFGYYEILIPEVMKQEALIFLEKLNSNGI